MAAAAVVPVENLSFVPLPDGLLKGSFSVNVPDDGDCFYHAILTYLKVTKPNHKFGNEQVTNMNIGSFKEYLLNLALTIRDTPGEVIESLTQKGCWAGEATTVWFVSNVGLNIDFYNISSDDININRFEIPGNEDTVKLVFTGNHYMAYFFEDSGVKVADLGLETLDVDETMAKKVNRKKLDEENKSPDIFSTITSLLKAFDLASTQDLRRDLANLKEKGHINDSQFKSLGEQLKELGLKKYYYKKYLKYKLKYISLKKKYNSVLTN